MVNSTHGDLSAKAPHAKIKGKTKAKHTMIGALIAQGYSVKDVAKQVNMSESRIYHLLSEKDPIVNGEISRILNAVHAAVDRHLINLYTKALQKLDTMLSSPNEKIQLRAIDRIIKILSARTAKNANIPQYFAGQPQPQKLLPIEKIIWEKWKQRAG